MSKVKNEEELNKIKDEIKKVQVLNLIDFQQKIEDKNAKFSMTKRMESEDPNH